MARTELRARAATNYPTSVRVQVNRINGTKKRVTQELLSPGWHASVRVEVAWQSQVAYWYGVLGTSNPAWRVRRAALRSAQGR